MKLNTTIPTITLDGQSECFEGTPYEGEVFEVVLTLNTKNVLRASQKANTKIRDELTEKFIETNGREPTQEFWDKAYPEIDTIPNKIAQMLKAGYLPIATFTVPETCWTDYYSAMQKTQRSFLKKYKGNRTAEEFVAYQRYETELYHKYKAHYGYVFYIGKKI